MKAKRKLTDMDFSAPDSHIALVSKTLQSGAANGRNEALILKSVSQMKPDLSKQIQKAQVQVTMTFADFLSRFFNIWSDDAESIALMCGMEEPEETPTEEMYQSYAMSKITSFEIMKSLNESSNLAEDISKLDSGVYLSLLRDQAMLEKAWKNAEKPKKKTQSKQKETMSTETVEKSQHELILKSLEDTKIELQKAKDMLTAFETEKKEIIKAARKEVLKDVLGDEAKTETLFKSLSEVDEATFDATIEVLKGLTKAQENSELFKEVGATTEQTAGANDEVRKAFKQLAKSKYNK